MDFCCFYFPLFCIHWLMDHVISLSHDQQCSYMNGVSDFGHSIFVIRCYKTVK